jgi:hypothetical protein
MFLLRLAPAPEKVEGIWRHPPTRGLHRDFSFPIVAIGLAHKEESRVTASPDDARLGKFVGALNRNQDSWCKWLVVRRADRLFTKKYRLFGLLRETEPGYTALRY